jgi:hypothetical protein
MARLSSATPIGVSGMTHVSYAGGMLGLEWACRRGGQPTGLGLALLGNLMLLSRQGPDLLDHLVWQEWLGDELVGPSF